MSGTNNGHESKTYTVKELASIIEAHPQSIRGWIRNGSLKAVRIGNNYRMSPKDLNEWWRSRGGGQLVPEPDTDQGGQ